MFRNEDQQYITSGNATHFYNKAGTVATRLPRRRDDTQQVFVRCTRDVGGEALMGTVVKVRPERVHDVLRSLMVTSPIYRNVTYDADAMRGMREEDIIEADADAEADADNADADDADDADEDATDTVDIPLEPPGAAGSSRANIVDEHASDDAPQADPALGGATADAANVFVDIEDERGFSADLNELLDSAIQPRFSLEDSVNMVERDADVICAIFPQHFKDGKGGPTTSVLTLSEYFRHALMWHDERFAQDIEWIFFAYKYEIKRKLFGVCVRATKDQPDVTAAGLEKARRAAAAADSPEGTGAQERSSAFDEGKRVMERLSVFASAMQVRLDFVHVTKP